MPLDIYQIISSFDCKVCSRAFYSVLYINVAALVCDKSEHNIKYGSKFTIWSLLKIYKKWIAELTDITKSLYQNS